MFQVGNERTMAISPSAAPLASFVVDTGSWRSAPVGPEAFDSHLQRAATYGEPAPPAPERSGDDDSTVEETPAAPDMSGQAEAADQTTAPADGEQEPANGDVGEKADAKTTSNQGDTRPQSPEDAKAIEKARVAGSQGAEGKAPLAESEDNETRQSGHAADADVKTQPGDERRGRPSQSPLQGGQAPSSDKTPGEPTDGATASPDGDRRVKQPHPPERANAKSSVQTDRATEDPQAADDPRVEGAPVSNGQLQHGAAEALPAESRELQSEGRRDAKRPTVDAEGKPRPAAPSAQEPPGQVAVQSATETIRPQGSIVASQAAAVEGEAREPGEPAAPTPKPLEASNAEARTDVSAARTPPGSRGAVGHGERALSGPPTDHADHAQFVQRVARAFQAMGDREGPVRLKLHPPELGSLRIEIHVRGGLLTARVEAETSAARNLLLDNLPALRDRLAQQDIKVQQFEVDLGDRSQGGTSQHTAHQTPFEERSPGRRHKPSPSNQHSDAQDASTAAKAISRPGEKNQLDVSI